MATNQKCRRLQKGHRQSQIQIPSPSQSQGLQNLQTDLLVDSLQNNGQKRKLLFPLSVRTIYQQWPCQMGNARWV